MTLFEQVVRECAKGPCQKTFLVSLHLLSFSSLTMTATEMLYLPCLVLLSIIYMSLFETNSDCLAV